MNNKKYPEYFARRIPVQGSKDLIELVVKYSIDRTSLYFELVINGNKHDDHEMELTKEHTRGIFYRGPLTLKGTLDQDIPVRVVARHGLSSRPEYIFYVGQQEVHKENGFPYSY